jgi:hypothetical protein
MSRPEGLYFIKEFVEEKSQQDLIAWLDKQAWVPIDYGARLVLQYGKRFDYKTYNIFDDVGPIPEPLLGLKTKIEQHVFDLTGTKPEFSQVIVNNYFPGQGISPHVDWTAFGPVIACVSLTKLDKNPTLDGWLYTKPRTKSYGFMEFRKGDNYYEMETTPGSLYVMTKESRHSMPARKRRY